MIEFEEGGEVVRVGELTPPSTMTSDFDNWMKHLFLAPRRVPAIRYEAIDQDTVDINTIPRYTYYEERDRAEEQWRVYAYNLPADDDIPF